MKFFASHLVAALVAGLIIALIWIYSPNLDPNTTATADVFQRHEVVEKALIVLTLPVGIGILTYLFTLPFVLLLYGLPERNKKLLNLKIYSILGMIIPVIIFTPGFLYAASQGDFDAFLNIVFGLLIFAGFAGGLTFGIFRKFIFKPDWLD